jgi:WD40 repeat protein
LVFLFIFKTRIITGGFDRTVKLWSLDGNLLQKFDGFSDTISSIVYIIPTQTLWISSNSPGPIVYDPRSGINVSDFVETQSDHLKAGRGAFFFKQLLFIPETNEVIGTTSRRSIVSWKYNPTASCTILPGHSDIVECLCFSIVKRI